MSSKKDDKSYIEERMAICLGCPRLFKPTKQCKECGCFMRIKTRLRSAECPIGKW